MRAEKIAQDGRPVSSFRHRSLSNSGSGILNGCLRIVRALWPQPCVLCGADTRGAAFCEPCTAELPRLPAQRCEICAMPLAAGAVCGACLRQPPRFDRVEAALAYRYPVDRLVHALKYGRRLSLAPALGALLAQAVAYEADVVVPMPLAPGRLAERGFNQALEIARALCARSGTPLLRDACRRVVDTPPQAMLPWTERAKNVRRAFVCDAGLEGLRVAVVDDVLTTGATMNELARVLKRAGAASVSAWAVARTL